MSAGSPITLTGFWWIPISRSKQMTEYYLKFYQDLGDTDSVFK